MNTLGLRVSPQNIFFCVVERINDEVNIEVLDKIIVPISLTVPDQLSYIRTTIYTIITQYNIDNAIIRRIEDNSRTINIARVNIEGVLQELISNCRIKKYRTCKLAQLGQTLGQNTKKMKECVEGNNLYEIERWDQYKKEERESVLCAFAASEL